MGKCSDEFIAQVMEMHYGLGFSWEYISLKLKIPQATLKNRVCFARKYGMKNHRLDNFEYKIYLQRHKIKQSKMVGTCKQQNCTMAGHFMQTAADVGLL